MLRVFRQKESEIESSPSSYGQVLKALSELKVSSDLDGTIFIHEGIILGKENAFSEKQNSDFVREVNDLIAHNKSKSRNFRRLLFGYDAGAILIFHTPPYMLCLFFKDVANAANVEKAGEHFLSTHSSSLKIIDSQKVVLPRIDLKKAITKEAEKIELKSVQAREKESKSASKQVVTFPLGENSSIKSKSKKSSPRKAADKKKSFIPEPVFKVVKGEDAKKENKKAQRIKPKPSGTPLKTNQNEKIAHSKQPESSMLPKKGESSFSAPTTDQIMNMPHSNDSSESWITFRTSLENLLSKVLGKAQTSRLIKRELNAMGIDGGEHLMAPQFRPFGMKLMQKVKDKALRKQLELELISLVEEHQK